MRNTSIKTISGAILVLMFLPFLSFAQTSPSAAILLQSTDTTITSTMPDTVLWFKFTAQTSFINAELDFLSKNGSSSAYSFELLDNNLSSIDFKADSNFTVNSTNLANGNQYYLKIKAQNNDVFELLLVNSSIVVYPPNTICTYPEECNLLTNADFSNTFYYATVSVTNASGVETNPLYIDPFGKALDALGLVNNNKDYYYNMVCDWDKIYSTPNVKTDSFFSNYAFMLGNNTYQEGIKTTTKVYPGIPYVLNYDFKDNVDSNSIINYKFIFGFTQAANLLTQNIPDSIANVLKQTRLINTLTNSWHHYTDTFTLPITSSLGSQMLDGLIIYPYTSDTGVTIRSGIDNIVLRPLSPPPPTPIISGKTFICAADTNSPYFNYKIENYDSLWVYYSEVYHNGALSNSEKIFSETFAANIGFNIETTIKVRVCGNEGSITVFRCCDPFSVSDSAIYYCNDTISTPQIIDGENISICGWLQIDADVTIKNSKLLFGPHSSIRIGSGYTLTLDNDSLSDACQYLWQGIYPSDSTSRLLVDSCYFEHSYSALNSFNNSKLKVEYSNFENNILGIHLRAYNPDDIWNPNNYTPPGPSTAYIAGNTFAFTNSYVSNAITISNPIGIKIDTVYQIIIGDSTSVIKRNIFDSLRYGIKATYSDLEVVNCDFNQINFTGYTGLNNYAVNKLNEPLEGAIHITKPKVAAGKLPPPQMANKALGNLHLIVGGDSTKSCTFNNCNFGVYSYNAFANVKYNSFTNQKYNAIYLKETVESYIEENNIYMSVAYPAGDEILKASIQVRNIMNLILGRKVWILNNTIHNTRTGISLLNCSSTTKASNNKYTKVGNNEIFFHNINANYYNYCGIKIQACDRIRIGGNIIESNVSPLVGWKIKNLIGISIAQSRETWIADNFSIRNMKAGIYAVGNCQNSQFACNKLFYNTYGIYFEPFNSSNGNATMVSSKGYSARASDNEWHDGQNSIFRIGGNLNMSGYIPNWYFRNNDILANKFSPDLLNTSNTNIISKIFPIPNTNVATQCAFQIDELPTDMDFKTISAMVRDLRLGDIAMENIDYMILEDEFEYFDQQYLYEILYTNPEIMNLGEADDSTYINFYNYMTNSNIREFLELQELIDTGDINAALISNGIIVAQNVIETNIQATNDIYLNTLAQDVEMDSVDRQNLFVIAMLTPYVGGEGVYTARAMLGIDPEDYNLPYRKGKPSDSTKIIEKDGVKVYPNPAYDKLYFEFEKETIFSELFIFDISGRLILSKHLYGKLSFIDLSSIKAGVYFYRLSNIDNETINGKFIKQ